MSSVMPAAASASASMRECVVVAGWITRVLASPTLARWDISSVPSIKAWPALRPPLTPKLTMEPAPFGKYFLASAWLEWSGRLG